MTQTKNLVLVLVVAILLAGDIPSLAGAEPASPDRAPISFASLLEEVIDRDRLASRPDPAYTCKQASSYERLSVAPDKPGWFANHDWSHFLRSEENQGRTEWVMMDVAGPGCVTRIWLGGVRPVKGVMRFYLDGSDKPVIEGKADDLIDKHGLVDEPLAAVRSRGSNLYLPIPYARRCKITYDGPNFWQTNTGGDRVWYNINYRTYPENTSVESFTTDTLKAAKKQVDALGKTLLKPPAAQPGNELQTITMQGRLAPDRIAGRAISGPGALRQITFQLDAEDLTGALRSTVLKIAFDDEQTVWCPLGDFFGSGVGLNPYKGWWRSIDENGRMTCCWTMPFKKNCTIEVENLGRQTVQIAFGQIKHGPWQWNDRSMYFHTAWRHDSFVTKEEDGFDFNYVNIVGKGVYMGDTFTLHNGAATWWGEGDEKIFVNGESFPSHFGTGTEDYYGYSYGHPAFFEAPFHAQPRGKGNNLIDYTTNTRTRSLDAIPFDQSLQFDMEIWHWQTTRMTVAAATYWYARPGAICNHAPDPISARKLIFPSFEPMLDPDHVKPKKNAD